MLVGFYLRQFLDFDDAGSCYCIFSLKNTNVAAERGEGLNGERDVFNNRMNI